MKTKLKMNCELWRFVLDLFYKEGQGTLTYSEKRSLAFYVAELNLNPEMHKDLPYNEISHLLTPVEGRLLPNCAIVGR